MHPMDARRNETLLPWRHHDLEVPVVSCALTFQTSSGTFEECMLYDIVVGIEVMVFLMYRHGYAM